MKSLINTLSLVYPPITNQEADWLWEDKEVREYVKESKLYMIVQRRCIQFYETEFVFEKYHIEFKLKMGEMYSTKIVLNLKNKIKNLDECTLELGNKLIRIKDKNGNVLFWMTPDIFLFQLWRNEISDLTIDEDFKTYEFTTFKVHYIGISKENDSFSRLFKNGHHARSKILSNVNPMDVNSRVTDEILILLFDIKKFNITSFIEYDEKYLNYSTEDLNVVADSEKAFIKVLDPEYNKEKYCNYPCGKDGLFNEGLDKYIYSIAEDICLYTDSSKIKGEYSQRVNYDSIVVEGKDIKVLNLNNSNL